MFVTDLGTWTVCINVKINILLTIFFCLSFAIQPKKLQKEKKYILFYHRWMLYFCTTWCLDLFLFEPKVGQASKDYVKNKSEEI